MGAGWLAVCAGAAFSLVYFAEIKSFARTAFGLPGPDTVQEGARNARQSAQPQDRRRGSGVVELKAGSHGHYYTRAEINGRAVDVLVDTGASIVALTYEDARRAGVTIRDSDYTQRVNTANGIARVAPVVIERISIGDITVRNVPAAVGEPGKLSTTLLGMSFLSRLQRVDMRSGVLILQE